ncbi:CHASE3 domain-containing protein [Brevundimonas sp. Root1423]|uniref:sensor histidine kinase n=1 Tax=Brevundimonas sp. Root1423 TaxID=1736462 RepID=UPI0006F447A2|nr:sensor histidine kinase [Brevundimonas sp. Root1423]KQY80328.1 histidine kinase [Brevundimonas sp. Root1423]
MIPALRPTLLALGHFLRTSSLSRSVVALLTGAIILLLVVNVGVFVMLQRTSDFNQTVEEGQTIRLAAIEVMTLSVDAETGQRGYMLTGQPEYLEPYNASTAQLPDRFDELARLTAGDPDLASRVERLRALSQQRLDIIDRTIALGRMGRMGDAILILRDGSGKVIMDQMRAETAAIDEIQATRLQFATRQTEWASGVTVLVNALAAVLILALAGVSGWLIRRYVLEIQHARDALDAMNAGLESKVRDRTFDLTRANDEIQRFAYIVSHDLRAPLVNVMGFTSELEQAGKIIDRQMTAVETKAPKLVEQDALTAVREDMPESIGFIRASTEKMDRLINAILKLSREGRRLLVPERLDMTAMAQGVADSVRHQTEASDAEIVIEPLPTIESDRLSMEQILGNLVDNAVKYLDPTRPGRIVVSGKETGDGWIVYRIADNGRGISERDHERIFELFRRSGKQDRAGEGLGLAFVRNSVRRLGGDITVESELGKGSTFMLKFPTRLVLADAGDY